MKRVESAILKRSLLSPTLALQSLLAALQLLDAFQVRYFATIHRAVTNKTFSLGFNLTPALLLLSSITIAYLLMQKRYREILIPISASVGLYLLFGLEASAASLSILLTVSTLLSSGWLQDYVFWVLALLIGFEVAALLHWVLLPLGIASPLAWFADLELHLYYINATLAPIITILTLCMWFLKPLAKRYLGTVVDFLISCLKLDAKFEREEIRLNHRALLVLSVVVAAVGALYPYSPNVNPESIQVGVDIKNYVNMMDSVEQNPSAAFTVANGSRPIIFLTIYAFKQVLGLEVLEAVKYLPILLYPLLTLSVYFMVSQASGDDEWAGLAALFTALGFKVTVGNYSYYLANLLALALIFSGLGFLFKNLRIKDSAIPVVASALTSLAIFTHPWTFTQFYVPLALLGFVLGYMYLKGEPSGFSTILVFLIVTGLVDLLKGVLMGGLEGFGVVTGTVPYVLRIDYFWKNNIFVFRYLYGGLLSNTILLGLAAVGIYTLNYRKPYQFFQISLLSTSSIYYFISHIMYRELPYNSVPARILYNLPFGVLTGLVIISLIRNSNLERRVRIATSVFIAVYMAVYLLRSLANLIY